MFGWMGRKKSIEVPNYIKNYINSNSVLGQPFVHRVTKYKEYVVIKTNHENLGFINIWMITFRKKKPYKELLMSLHIQDDATLKILDIKVLGGDRSKGYGTVFMDELFEIVKSKDIKKITGLAERPKDPQLVNFYAKYDISIIDTNLYWVSHERQ